MKPLFVRRNLGVSKKITSRTWISIGLPRLRITVELLRTRRAIFPELVEMRRLGEVIALQEQLVLTVLSGSGMALVAATCRVIDVALMKRPLPPANALARAIRVPALQTGALPKQSSYQSARDASIMSSFHG